MSAETMKVVEVPEPGGPDSMKIGTRDVPSIRPDEVLVRVIAAGVNGPDLVQRRGHYPPPKGASDLLGLEVSGTVVAVGSDCVRFKEGDTICALTNGGGYAEYVAINEGHCLAIPDGVDVVDAAGLPEVYFTVWSNIFLDQDVQPGANVLVQGGAGGIGSAAVQTCKAMGLNVFATAGSDENLLFCKELGADRVVNYKEEDFVDILRDAGGADIILDIVGAPYMKQHVKASRHDARLISLAFNGGSRVEFDFLPMMLKRLTLTGSTLRSRSDAYKTKIARSVEAVLWPKIADGSIKTVTHKVFAIDDVVDAHKMMEGSQHRGKILLKM